MADDPGATPTPATPDATPEQPATPRNEEPKGDDTPLAPPGEKALEAMKVRAREAEAEVKELRPLAEKARELEEAQQSEIEKAQAKLNKAEQNRQAAEAKLLRFEVAQEKEIPAKLVPLLTGSTKEDLEAQADLILENVKAGATPDFDGGAREPAPDPKTPDQQHNESVLGLFGISNT